MRDRVKELRRVRAGELIANPRNWREHPERQRKVMRKMIGEIGVADAVIAYETPQGLMLIDGHLRAGLDKDAVLPVLVVDLNEDEANALLATLDPLAEMAEKSEEAYQRLLEAIPDDIAALFGDEVKVKSEESDAEVTPREEGPTRSALGDLWLIGEGHRLLVGDSTVEENIKRLMGNDLAEMVWTDPPYGVAIGDKNVFLNSIARSNRVEENLTNDTLDEDGLTSMLTAAFGNAAKYCTPGASWYVAAPAGPLHLIFGAVLKNMGIWRQTIQWVKNNATFSPMGVSYHWQAEPIFYGWLPNGAKRFHGDRKQTTVWNIDRPTKSPDHPTMKPVELVKRAISHASMPTEIVLDLFLGSGTTLLAAHSLGRVCYGCEISPRYADVILRRAEAEGMVVKLEDSTGA